MNQLLPGTLINSCLIIEMFTILLHRMFYKGRTETIRPVSEFSCKFARLFDDPSAKDEEKKDTLKKAIG